MGDRVGGWPVSIKKKTHTLRDATKPLLYSLSLGCLLRGGDKLNENDVEICLV
jgi:hypothetical protein